MSVIIIIVYGLFLLATISEILGLGVAFAAIPFLGSFTGARITSQYVPSGRIKQMFVIMILVVTIYKIYTLIA